MPVAAWAAGQADPTTALAADPAVVGATQPASAPADATPDLAVLGFDIGGTAPVDPGVLATKLSGNLRDGLTTAGYTVADQTEVAAVLQRNKALIGCYAQDCFATLSDLLGVSRFVHARVDAFGQNFTVSLDLYASDRPVSLVTHVEQKCEVCTLGELQDSVAAAAKTLHDQDVAPATAPAASQPVEIDSDPSGAAVSIDGEPHGQTNETVSLAIGSHIVVVQGDGYLPSTRTITVDNRPASVSLSLVKSAVTVTETPTDRPFHTWKWVALGGSAALLTTGVIFLSLDGQGSCGGPGQCPQVYDTSNTGWALVGLGTVGAIGTTALFLFDKPSNDVNASAQALRARTQPLSLMPVRRGVVASFTQTF
jgi:hypothetical protein